jgi:hypothetical protein
VTAATIAWQPNPGKQTEFLARAEDIVLYGGAKGGGKSDAMLGEATRQTDNPNYKGLILRRTFPQLQELIDRAKILYPKLGAKWLGSEKRFYFKSGSYIEFGHCQTEADKERYQGREFSFIGFDQLEQFLESQFTFIMAACRNSDSSLKCYIRASANPGSVGHQWVKRRWITGKEAGRTYKEIYDLPDGRKVTRTSCYIKATVYDNPKLLEAQPTYLANLMGLPEMERRAYLDGDWNAFTSQCVFDKHGLQLQEAKIVDPEWVGYLQEHQETFRIMPDPQGNLRIFKEPEANAEYEIGVDSAEGDELGDYSSAHVVNKKTWEVVAIWHGHRAPFEYGKIVSHLGYYYNTAEIAVEVPGPGISVVAKLVELGYPAVYKYDTEKYGWINNVATRTNMLSTLLGAVKDGSVKIKDRYTLDEMCDFIRNEKTQKIEAREGSHDDRVMSLGIALQCIRVNPFYEPLPRNRRTPIFAASVVPERTGRRSATGYR